MKTRKHELKETPSYLADTIRFGQHRVHLIYTAAFARTTAD